MMPDEINEFEMKVLREINGDSQPDLITGAAINAAIEFLRTSGYITRGLVAELTPKGLMAIMKDSAGQS